jgi:His/Glu/Gln/Arg/opine family amino acid ABC transporter permease subunit
MPFADTVETDVLVHKPWFVAALFLAVFLLFLAIDLTGTAAGEWMRPVIGEPSESGLAGRAAIAFTLAKLSSNGIAQGIAHFYTSLFRGLPLLMQIYMIYLGLPQLGYVVDAVPTGIAALSLCYGAYMTEIFRAGIESIPKGQWEAARALGMRPVSVMTRIILPQSMRGDHSAHRQPVHFDAEGQLARLGRRGVGADVSGSHPRPENLSAHGNADHRGDVVLGHVDRAGTDPGPHRAPLCPEQGPMTTEAIIQATDVCKWYGDFHVLRDINLTVMKGERIVIAGPSGSGKSTLIRCINRLEEHQKGQIIVNGTELTSDLKRIDEVRRECRHGVPALQPVPAPDHPAEPDAGARSGCAASPKARGRAPGHEVPGARAHSGAGQQVSPASCRAASSSAWPSPARCA